MQTGTKKRAGVTIWIPDKIDFQKELLLETERFFYNDKSVSPLWRCDSCKNICFLWWSPKTYKAEMTALKGKYSSTIIVANINVPFSIIEQLDKLRSLEEYCKSRRPMTSREHSTHQQNMHSFQMHNWT